MKMKKIVWEQLPREEGIVGTHYGAKLAFGCSVHVKRSGNYWTADFTGPISAPWMASRTLEGIKQRVEATWYGYVQDEIDDGTPCEYCRGDKAIQLGSFNLIIDRGMISVKNLPQYQVVIHYCPICGRVV